MFGRDGEGGYGGSGGMKGGGGLGISAAIIERKVLLEEARSVGAVRL